jgi:hypothetical protein
MWNFDWTAPLLLLGVACVLGAIVGGNITALGFKVPVLKSVPMRALLAFFGLVLIFGPQLVQWENERDKLAVERVEASVEPQLYVGCEPEVQFTAKVVMKGKNGKLPLALQAVWTEVHLEVDPSQQQVIKYVIDLPGLTAENSDLQTVSATWPRTVLAGSPSRTDYQMHIHLLRPVDMVSNSVPFSVQCEQGTSPDASGSSGRQ